LKHQSLVGLLEDLASSSLVVDIEEREIDEFLFVVV
jgi:hypothetical protein